jgi:hypothetical protein
MEKEGNGREGEELEGGEEGNDCPSRLHLSKVGPSHNKLQENIDLAKLSS